MELLEMDYSDDATFLNRINAMHLSAQKMAQLTRQLLAYSRGGKYIPKTVTINDIIKDLLPLVRGSIDPSIEIITDLAPDIPAVEADVTEMQMVMTAVVKNATEAILDSGQIRITTKEKVMYKTEAAAHHSLSQGSYVLLSIEDSGKGMDKRTLDRMFEPFFTTSFQGRGLGMAAVYGIIENHGGWIDVTSKPGRGTTVDIYLPVKAENTAVTESENSQETTKLKTVLIIDDEEMVVEVCTSMLKKLGYDALGVMNAKSAIRIVNDPDATIDLVFLDIKMPDMDGEVLFTQLKDIRPDLKVVICSGNSLNGHVKRMMEAGAVGYIQKPFRMEKLSAELDKYLSE